MIYEKIFKRFFDFVLSLAALIVLSPLLAVLTVVGAIAMRGNPFFTQPRPGRIDRKSGAEKIFKLIKFRTMTNAVGADGKLLPDDKRLNGYGSFLRTTSLDELPSLINIIVGDLSIVGPRPFLVRDMVFMDERQRRRHCVRPGLTGLAQISGRNNISWEQKFDYDLKYIDDGITLAGDIVIILKTVGKVLKRSDIVRDGTVSDIDFGDYLLEKSEITRELYDEKMAEARGLIEVG